MAPSRHAFLQLPPASFVVFDRSWCLRKAANLAWPLELVCVRQLAFTVEAPYVELHEV